MKTVDVTMSEKQFFEYVERAAAENRDINELIAEDLADKAAAAEQEQASEVIH